MPVSGGLPEAAAPQRHPKVSGPFPSRLAFRGPHRQPPSASERLRGQPHRPRSSAEEDHPGGALVGTGMLFTYQDPFVGEGRGVVLCFFLFFFTLFVIQRGLSNGNVPVLFYSGSFLQFKGHAPPPRLTSLLMFLLELLRRNNDSEPALLTLPLPPLLRCVMMANDPQGRCLLVSTAPCTCSPS